MTLTTTGSISTKHIKINIQAPSHRTIGAGSGLPSDVSRPKSNNKDPEEEQSKNVLGEKGSRSCKYIMIYDPASDKYETQERFHSTKCWELTNRPKMTKVKSNQYYSPVWTSSLFFWIFSEGHPIPKTSQVKKVANLVEYNHFVTLPRTSTHSRAFPFNK